MLVYDFEVFKEDWLVVIADLEKEEVTTITNDADKLRAFYELHKHDIWIGFNSRSYDSFILKGILCGYNPFKISQFIIEDGRKGFEFSKEFNQIKFLNYDCMTGFFGLKTLEAFMGDMIKESDVSFLIDRKLTEEELEQTKFYCEHDVRETIKVFANRKADFDAYLSILEKFDLPIENISKTKAQLSAIVLGAKRRECEDEWDIRLPETLKIEKYTHVCDWFLNEENHNDNAKLETEIDGCPHVVAWGGLHGALNRFSYKCEDDEVLVMADVDQLYPTIMIKYNLLSRAITKKDLFPKILAISLELKAKGLKAQRLPYKEICNITYGAMGDKYNPMYDPRNKKLVCVFGQLLMIDLIEKIEDFTQLIQSNTDGILIKVKKADLPRLNEEIEKWQDRVMLHMSSDDYLKVIQRDVNNYIVVPFGELYDKKGKPRWKAKGAVVKQLSKLDYDLPIVNEAVKMWFLKGIPPEKTVWDCDELIKFQNIFKLSSAYKEARIGCSFRKEKSKNVWNEDGEILKDKTFRVFASLGETGALYKKKDNKNPEKFANCPDNCFIENESIVGKSCSEYPLLDKNWYVELANDRIRKFV